MQKSYLRHCNGSHCELLQGHSVDDFALNKASAVSAFDWHPSKKALACGWESGGVAVYDLLHRELTSVSSLHKHPVSIILWTCSGTRLVTGDRVICLSDYN